MWNDDLMEALRSGDPEKIKEVAHLARSRYQPIEPKFDYKKLESEGREPGEDSD